MTFARSSLSYEEGLLASSVKNFAGLLLFCTCEKSNKKYIIIFILQ